MQRIAHAITEVTRSARRTARTFDWRLMTVTETRQVAPSAPELTHREILEILIGLLAALFTAMLSSIVSNALPTIIADLEGSQTQYTWVLTASLLATTVSTPIWGKLADLMSKKLLVSWRSRCSWSVRRWPACPTTCRS